MAREIQIKNYDGVSPWRYAHVKRDGRWVTLRRTADGTVMAWSRRPRSLTAQLEWHPALRAFASATDKLGPAECYCEAYVPGGVREDAVGYDHPDLRLECFAIKTIGGVDLRPETDLTYVHHVSEQELDLPFTPYLIGGALTRDLTVVGPDQEGWVLKDGNLLNWRKVKPVVTYDLRICGFTPGRGKYEGQVGAIVLTDLSGAVVAQAGGMTDAVRRQMTDSPSEFMGRICEVEAQGRGSAGGLMHPRFVRMRDDEKTEPDLLG